MATDHDIRIRITGDSAGATRAARESTKALGELEKKTAGVARAAAQMATAIAGGALVVGVARAADEFNSMTARLKLATTSLAEFQVAQAEVARIATATAAPIASIGELFAKLSPAMRAAGADATETAKLTEIVAQTLRLSAAGAAETASFVTQFGQAMGAGALRGEEFNAVMDSNIAFAQAMADGLGVPLGALRAMAEQGELTAAVIRDAVGGQFEEIKRQAEALPRSISGAFTGLQNAFTVYVGQTDQATGASRAFVQVLNGIAENFSTVATVVAGVGVVFAGRYVGGLVAAAKASVIAQRAALTLAGGTAAAGTSAGVAAVAVRSLVAAFGGIPGLIVTLGALAVGWFATRDATTEAEKATLAKNEAEADAQKLAKESVRIELQRAELTKRRAEQEAILAKAERAALVDVRKIAKDALEERIKGQENLVKAVRTALQETVEEERKAAEARQKIVDEAANKRLSREDQIAAKKRSALPPEERAAAELRNARDLTREADVLGARATLAALSGDTKAAEKFAQQALARAETAATAADALDDPQQSIAILRQIMEVEEAAFATRAKVEEKRGEDAKAQAETQSSLLIQLEQSLAEAKAELVALTAEIKTLTETDKQIKVDAEVDAAKAAIESLNAQIAALPKRVSVEVVPVSVGGGGDEAEEFASGGMIRGPGSDTSDNIPAWLSPGEFVIRAAAVRKYGAGWLSRLNSMSIPRFANGGAVSGFSPAMAGIPRGESKTPVVFNFPELGRFSASASPDVVSAIRSAFARESLKRGRR